MALIRRTHEWAADRFRFVQYPRERARGRLVTEPRDWTAVALKWMAFGFGMWLIWGGFFVIAACVVIALAG